MPKFLERCVYAYKERRRFGKLFQGCCVMNREQENYEEQQQESVIQLVTVLNANFPICFSQPVPTVDRQWNYLDHMSTTARQQQRDHDREQHTEARARLTYQ